jgi:hypothetical protein
MRWLIVLFFVACDWTAADTNDPCPPPAEQTPEGQACHLAAGKQCFVENTFSPCLSAWYRCDQGKWIRDHPLNASDGQSCAGSPLASCNYEGNPSCDTLPTAESCGCGTDGKWRCSCQCYGSQTTCSALCPPDYPGPGAMGPACTDAGQVCTYPGHTCTCTSGHFACV